MTSCAKELEGFADLDKCQQVIERVLNDDDAHEKSLEEFKKTIQIYSQQPQLLDPHITALILKLTSRLSILSESDSIRYHAIFKILYELTVVSGFKNAAQKFPHEIDKLPMVLAMLAKENPEDKSHWETRYVLTVWLSILVLAPFDLKKFDMASDQDSTSSRIYTLLMRNIVLHDSCQHVSSYCLSKFFSRTDIIAANDCIDKFFNEALKEIANTKLGSANSTDDIKLIGYLRTLAYMYEFLPRDCMKTRSPLLLQTITDSNLINIDRILINHVMIKVIQRAGLSLLPVRLAKWRYKRATRVIGTLKDFSQGITSVQPGCDDEQALNYTEEQESIENIETILSCLFMAARNSQTRIRWSGAKGIARAASRLSKERAGDIIDMVTEGFFSPESNENAWHGGCLILAEMSRHGLILEEKLDHVISIVKDAIVYDKIKGSMATGSHIREAACYICWAMSRTYEDNILKPYIPALSANLLCNMLFDRELQCRRAASATFQELIGRQGAFSQDEINLLTDLDYHNVGQRQFAYLHLAPMVAKQGDKYLEPFVEHLIDLKVAHWDMEIRRLSSKAVAALMLNYDENKIKEIALPRLIDMCSQNDDNNMKHGGILTLANVIEALVPLNYPFDDKFVNFVGSIAKGCDKQLKTKLNAPKFIEAIGLLIQSSEKAQFKQTSETIKCWESIVMSSLDMDSPDLRKIGADAFLSLYRGYYSSDKSQQDRLLTTVNKMLQSPNESSRCGALVALSRLSQAPSVLFGEIRRDADIVDIVLMSLTSYVSKETHEKAQDICFPKAKAQSCESLIEFIRHLDDTCLLTSSNLIQAAYDSLLQKLDDYTFDQRGDIGVTVRQAAIQSLVEMTLLLSARGRKSIFTKERIQTLISKIVQQAVAYHDNCRELAGKSFYQLLASEDIPADLIPHKESILKLFSRFEVDETFEWRHESMPIFVKLLTLPEYSPNLWRGLISAVGQLSVMGARQSKIALTDYLRNLDTDKDLVFLSLMETLDEMKDGDRSIMPALSLVDFLLVEGLLDAPICADRLSKFCWRLSETTDIKRLMAITRILTELSQIDLSEDGSSEVNEAMKYCLSLLLTGYPKIRGFVAEQLYMSMLTHSSDLESSLQGLLTQLSKFNINKNNSAKGN